MLFIDIAGQEATCEELEKLRHPLVVGVILFTRNYRDPIQLGELTRQLRHAAPRLLICVDQEGGRVQRFRQGFHLLPPMATLGHMWERERDLALSLARDWGVVLAGQLRRCGVDFSFTPVLDLDYGHSQIIGDRALHSTPDGVCALAAALMGGLAAVGVAAVGKHFPGHGHVAADSHETLPVDPRPFAALWEADLVPYRRLGAKLAAVMSAHVVYPDWDDQLASYSRRWLQDVLRQRLGYAGLIFSDDLSMEGARSSGGIRQSADAALAAGCDLLLVCNNPQAVDQLLQGWQPPSHPPCDLSTLAPRHSNYEKHLAEASARLNLSAGVG